MEAFEVVVFETLNIANGDESFCEEEKFMSYDFYELISNKKFQKIYLPPIGFKFKEM